MQEHPKIYATILSARYEDATALETIEGLARREFPGRIAAVSSFGSESAVLLDLIAQVDPSIPVVFLDTRKHFGETLRYRDALIRRLGLSDVRSVRPDTAEVDRRDPDGMLWQRDPDACCALRKVAPLEHALAGFDAWFTGRKRYQGATRSALPLVEDADGRIKVNPLASWSAEDIARHMHRRDLPAHPLVADGFVSIGCMPCTDRVVPGEDTRAGRWRGSDKTECGIHR